MAIARGNLDMSITSAQELAKLIPEWSIFTAGYLMRDPEHQRKVFEGDIGAEMYALVEEKLNVKLLGMMYFGTRQLNLRGDMTIKTPADMAGINLRMPGTDAWQFLGKALGANQTPMAFTEVYTGLQTGAIDGQDNPMPTDKDKKFYEVTDQIVLTGHLVDMNFLAFSKTVWDGLSADQQATVMQASRDAMASITASIVDNEAQLVAFFEGEGLRVYTPDVDAFRAQASLATRLGDDAVGEMILSELPDEGINLDQIHCAPAGISAFSSIYVANNGDRQIVHFRGTGLSDDLQSLEMPASVDVALADTRWDAGAQKTLNTAKSRGILGVLEAESPIHPDLINTASHIAFSRQGLTDLTAEPDLIKALTAVSAATSAWVCATDGASGVYFVDAKRIENIPAFPVTAIDTLAAGDVWHGAFCLGLAEGRDEHSAMEFANAAAALKCTQFGGRKGCPDRKATENLLKKVHEDGQANAKPGQ